jgi:putative tricarboxylic transport membrane protein
MGKADRISGMAGLLFSIFMSIQSSLLGLGTLHKPGPGFLFFWTSITLGILSLVILVRTWVRKATGEEEPIFRRGRLRKVSWVLGSTFLYVFLLERVGFIPVTLMLFLFLLGIIEKKQWSFSIVASVAVTVVSYLIFEVWLKSQLPKGILEFLHF